MRQLLHVNASPRGAASQSLALAGTFLDAFRARRPETAVDTLNLFDDELPAFGTVAAAAKITAFSGQSPTGEQADAWARAREVFDRFTAADAYLFNVPMWNAGVPYVLKHWVDILTQPGWAFAFDPSEGYTGLITGKKAAVIYTSGVYAPGVPLEFGADFHSTFFNDWLRFVGITEFADIRFSANALTATYDADFDRVRTEARELARSF